MEKLAGEKHSSLLQKLVNFGQEKFYNIGPLEQCYITFLSVIYECLKLARVISLASFSSLV
jgi:hypothetical protein